MKLTIFVILNTLLMILVNGSPTRDGSKNINTLLPKHNIYIFNSKVNINMISKDLKDVTNYKTSLKTVDSRLKSRVMDLDKDSKFESQPINMNIKNLGKTSTEKHCNFFKDEMIEERSEMFRKKTEFKNGTDGLIKRKEKGSVDAADDNTTKINSGKQDHNSRRSPYERNEDFSLEDEMSKNRIVGGFAVTVEEYPYHAGYGDHCGAAIIGTKWLITAAHCGEKYSARVGSKYYRAGKEYKVKKRYIHPEWSQISKKHDFDYDYQLIELEKELEFDENVQPVKIADPEDYVVGSLVSVTGWGSVIEDGPYSNVLKDVNLPLAEKRDCQNIDYPYFRGTLTERMFCAGYKDTKKDACQGDSGGPAVSRNHKLLGIVSFGYGCATPKSLGVYSNVAVVKDWINSVTGIRA